MNEDLPPDERLAESALADFALEADDIETAPHPRENLWPYFRTVDDLPPGYLHREELFDGARPLEIDIGCGRGKFLFESAVARPDTNFLGLELDYKEGRRAARRLAKRQLPNARLIGGDGRQVLTRHLEPHSIQAAHVYFPDPWWKRRHKRRRLFTDEFADTLAQLVMPGGFVHSWTDVGDYFEIIAALMDHRPDFERVPLPELPPPAHDLDYLTSFHRRKAQAGCQIWRGQWRRRPLSEST